MPTTSEYCEVAPMKKPDLESVVVPVLPMTVPACCWPKVTVCAAVPLMVVCSIAYCTSAARFGCRTERWSTFGICSAPSGPAAST